MKSGKNKRILFVIPYLANGGAQRALSNITTHFPNEWDIDILANSDKYISYPYKGNVISLGVDEKPRTSSVFFQFKVFLKRVRKLHYLKKEGQYAACISFLDSANVANILTGRKRCKVIVSVRSSLVNQAKLPQYRFIVNPLVHLLYNKADKVVAVSKGSAKELRDVFGIGQQRIAVISNGYDLEELMQYTREELDDKTASFIKAKRVILISGRITELKGHLHLIRAFARVVEQIEEAVLVIVGSGDYEEKLKELVGISEIREKILFTGFQRNPYKYVSKADIFVMPSMYEGFPNALAEAICLGIPGIASDFQTGAREILAPELLEKENAIEKFTQGEFGIIAPLCSGHSYNTIDEPLEQAEEELKKAILFLLQNEVVRKRYVEKSNERKKDMTIESAITAWIGVIESES